jgi:hypothetical protein
MFQAKSDVIEVVETWAGQTTIWIDVTAIYAGCVELADSIGKVDFMHYPREANKSADEISCNWVNEPPSFC